MLTTGLPLPGSVIGSPMTAGEHNPIAVSSASERVNEGCVAAAIVIFLALFEQILDSLAVFEIIFERTIVNLMLPS